MVQVFRKFLVPLLSVMLLGVTPAPVSATTTITGAVVAIPIAPYGNAGYRLTGQKATYLATFGSGNSDALITATGGCAIKSGNISCYGRAGTVGDGTNRNRPLAVPVSLPGGAQATKLVEFKSGGAGYQTSEGDYNFREARLMCAQGLTAVHCWGDNAGQVSLSPIAVYSGSTRLFTGNLLQAETGAIFHWEPADFSSATSPYVFTRLASGLEGFSASGISSIHLAYSNSFAWIGGTATQGYGALGACITTGNELRCLSAPVRSSMDERVAALFPPAEDPVPLTSATSFAGIPVLGRDSRGEFCSFVSPVISCTASEAYEEGEDFDLEADGTWYNGRVDVTRPSQMTPTFTLPDGSSEPVVVGDSNPMAACALHPIHGFVCVSEDQIDLPEEDEYLHDVDDDGLITIGREFSLDCGVGFSCAFTPSKLRVSGEIVTAVGTLIRTPRTSATLAGTVRFPDGVPFQGSIGWESSDGKLRATSTVAADGSFTLAARSGMGSITLSQLEVSQYLPSTCLDGTATAGCVTFSDTTIYLDTLAASSNVNITVPSYAGEMRTMDLRFGDGETPISDVALAVVDPETECSTTAVAIGRMVSCARQGGGLMADLLSTIKTGADGTVSLWMPTAMDSVLQASAADEYGLTWTDEIVSLGDDGVTPEPFSFAGLIFAQPLGAMSVRQGSTGTVSALVSVDGIDPAYGLSAGIKPASTVATTCSAERRTDATDENGLVDFSLCPAGTQLWKVYATDGSFFPSAPFPVTIDPALTALRVSGATLDTTFSGGTTTYTGRFTSSRVTFTPTKASWAGSARVTTPTCSRPSRGTRDCTMSVKVGSATITYRFTLRR
jgi:hypothetical protein